MAYVSIRSLLLPVFRRTISAIEGGEHLPERGPYLVAANHIDYLDGFVVAAAIHDVRRQPAYFLTKSNNYWWTRSTIPIERRGRSASVDDAFGYLRRGRIICNFVEGQRNDGPHLLAGRTGTARLALLTGVPVIPVGLSGSSSQSFVRALTNLMTGDRKVAVRIGPPVELDAYRGQALSYELLQEATKAILRSLVPLTGKAFAG